MGPGRDSLRIPVDSVIYPNDFMFFVLNYIYGEGIENKYFEKNIFYNFNEQKFTGTIAAKNSKEAKILYKVNL